jgi:ABC-type multidrug transport system ATPase subunit/pSer/pThr/pTyr-binding forkhead associated (FHA) protein
MPEASSNCPHCGKRLQRADAAFCTNCGTPLQSPTGQVVSTVHGGSLAKIVVNLPGQENREEFLSKAETTIGRSKKAMIQVMFPTVSGVHARLALTRQGHTITDLDSTNGTFVNGQRLKPGSSRQLNTNDIIRFSDALGNSASLTYFAPSGFSDVGEVDIRQTFTITDAVAYIGRNTDTAITLDHPAVSWYHAKLIRRDNDYTIQDLSSNNGTFLNGAQLRDSATPLTRGDVVQIGPFNLVYQGSGNFVPFSAERNFRLEAAGLVKTYYRHNLLGRPDPNRAKTVLNGIDLVINPREFVALVGGSGTGKSTLLKAISGVSPATAGAVLVNGDDLYINYNLYRTMMGYVPQDDIIHGGLMVRQALQYAAQLRLPDADHTNIEARIDDVLTRVGMTAQAGATIRDLSGGQRKRVSIAVELLAEPWIFFLDEPTSGLDPGLEKLMMDTLRQLADEGRTIVLVTHATSNILGNCDQVAFMAQGGRLAYFGPPAQAPHFFGVDNFADIYTHLSQTIDPAAPAVPAPIKAEYQRAIATNGQDSMAAGPLWAAHYRQSELHRTYVANRQSGELARPIPGNAASAQVGISEQWQQFAVLARRYTELIRNDRYSLTVLLAVMPVIAILLLLISNGSALVGNSVEEISAILEKDGFYSVANQAQTVLFMMALAANLLGVFAASFEIINEQPIYRRERMINLKLLPYFGSKFAVLGAFSLLQCLLLLLVLAFGMSFPGGGALSWAPLEYYFTLVFTALASVALGLFISAAAGSATTVIYLMLLTIFVQIVFSGAIFDLPAIVQPLSWLTITRWSLEALGASTGMEALNSLGQLRVERDVEMQRGIQTVVQDVPSAVTFYINYTSNAVGLFSRWIFLWVHTILWSGLAIWSLKRKDNL